MSTNVNPVGNALTGSTGTGSFVGSTSPALTTPSLGAATATSINGLTITSSTGTFTLANSKTFTCNNTLMFSGTDSSSIAFGAGGTVLYNGGALGTPSSGTLSSCTGYPLANLTGAGAGVLTFLATPSSANLLSALTTSTGTGSAVFGTSPTITTPNLVGTTTVGNASAGSVGELISSTIAYASKITLTNGTAANITSISLTAGDWDIEGNVYAVASIGFTQVACWASTTSASVPDPSVYNTIVGTATQVGQNVPYMRLNVSSTTTVYLSVYSNFSSGTGSACGAIFARRVR